MNKFKSCFNVINKNRVMSLILCIEFLLILYPVQFGVIQCFHSVTGLFKNTTYWCNVVLYFDLSFVLFTLLIICNKNNLSFVNYVVVLFLIVSFIVGNFVVISKHEAMSGYYNCFNFADLLKFIESYSESSSLYSSNYPPIGVLIYRLCNLMLGNGTSTLDDIQYAKNYILLIYMIFNIISISLLLFKITEGYELYKYLLVFAVFLSGCMIFAFQRMNVMILAFSLLLFFVYNYESKNNFYRHLAIIALALSANIKLYPAIFGLLFIKDKRYKDGIICALYGVGLFCLPAIIGDIIHIFNKDVSFGHITDLIRGISSFTNQVVHYNRGDMSLNTILYTFILDRSFVKNILNPNTIALIARACIGLYILVSLFMLKLVTKRYQILLILSLMSILIPKSSAYYTVVFVIPPLVMLLNQEYKDWYDLIILVLICVFINFNVVFFIWDFAISLIFIVLFIDVLVNFIKVSRGMK